MDTIINVCIVLLTIAAISVAIMAGIGLQNVRKMRIRLVDFLDKMERELRPVITEVTEISESIREITFATRCQVEKVESTTDFISKNVHDVVERWSATITLLSEALAEPVEDIAIFLKGFTRGMRYFFGNGREVENSR